MKPNSRLPVEQLWPHRLAVMLLCVTFPLIWVGGLVTTYDAGMSVPDWPSTYGYNLFLYPWQTWLFGPWDLFIEHSHRLLGALSGILTIAFVIAVFRCDARRWMRICAVAALVLVVLQGVLGGTRVLLDQRQIALLHGCMGPAFFAYCGALCIFTSRGWKQAAAAEPHPRGAVLHRLAGLTCLLTYAQLVVGAHLRHIPVAASPGTFRVTVLFHLLLAVLLVGHALALAYLIWIHRFPASLRRPAWALGILTLAQLLLGAATWVVNFSWPAALSAFPLTAGYTIEAEGLLQAMVTTAHVATGSVILALSVLVAVRSLRQVRAKSFALNTPRLLELAV